MTKRGSVTAVNIMNNDKNKKGSVKMINTVKKEGPVTLFNTIPEVTIHCLLILARRRRQICLDGHEMHKERDIVARIIGL
jgi:hypothetical protein